MRVKKISDEQFIFDVVKKGFEIAGAPINWSSWDELVEYSKEHKQWYTEAVFTTVEQYNQWKWNKHLSNLFHLAVVHALDKLPQQRQLLRIMHSGLLHSECMPQQESCLRIVLQ